MTCTNSKPKMKYFPAFLDLRDRLVLVVGGGPETEKKTKGLLNAGARIRFVSKEVPSWIETLPLLERERIDVSRTPFTEDHLNGVYLVLANPTEPKTSEKIFEAAEKRRIFCTVVDVIPCCSMIAPAVIQQGDVVVAISTSGTSPALAQRLKRELAPHVSRAYGHLARVLGKIRPIVQATIPDPDERAAFYRTIADSELLELWAENENPDQDRAGAESRPPVNSVIHDPEGDPIGEHDESDGAPHARAWHRDNRESPNETGRPRRTPAPRSTP